MAAGLKAVGITAEVIQTGIMVRNVHTVTNRLMEKKEPTAANRHSEDTQIAGTSVTSR